MGVPRLRFTMRRWMLAVAVVALFIASVPPVRRRYDRWSYLRFHAARCAQLEQQERRRETQERKLSNDRGAIKKLLMQKPGFQALSTAEQERRIFAEVFFHRVQCKRAHLQAVKWEENRRQSEKAAYECLKFWSPQ